MFYTTVVKVVAEGSNRPLPGVRVSLYDKDLFSPDDLLGTADTDAEGEARFRFTADKFAGDEDSVGPRGEFPELYAVVHAPDGSEVCSTREDAKDNLPRRHITITVPADAARTHGWAAAG
ncbi:MAG TPA: hypothetical protein VF746_19375 [Longimicrobium sp.]|jgi:hypothetical protein